MVVHCFFSTFIESRCTDVTEWERTFERLPHLSKFEQASKSHIPALGISAAEKSAGAVLPTHYISSGKNLRKAALRRSITHPKGHLHTTLFSVAKSRDNQRPTLLMHLEE